MSKNRYLYATAIVSIILVFFGLLSGWYPDNKEGVESGTYVINENQKRIAVLGVFDNPIDGNPKPPINLQYFTAVDNEEKPFYPYENDAEISSENLLTPELDVNPPLQTGSYIDIPRNEKFYFTLTGKDKLGWFGELKYGTILPREVYVYNVTSEQPGYAKSPEFHLIAKSKWREIVSKFYENYELDLYAPQDGNAKWLGYSLPVVYEDDSGGVPIIIRSPTPIDATDSGKRYSQAKGALKRVQSRNATTKKRYEDTDQHYATDVLRLIVMVFLVLVMVVSILNLRTIKNFIMRDTIKRNNDFSSMFS